MTVSRLDDMENELLNAQANKEPTPPSTLLKPVAPLPEKKVPPLLQQAQGQATLGAAAAGMQNSPLKYSSVLNRPAAGRVGANQKTATAPQTTAAPTAVGLAKAANGGKLTTTTTSLTKPATAATLRRNNNNNNSNGNNANVNNVKPFGGGSRTSTRYSAPAVSNPLPRPSSKTECYGPPNNVASRLSARSRTMLDMNGNAVASTATSLLASKPLTKRTGSTLLTHTGKRVSVSSNNNNNSNSSSSVHRQLSSREDIASSTSTLKASNEQLSSSRSTIKLDDRHSEPKQLHPDANDGWLTVKNRRRSSMHWANRFNQPTGYASLPTLALLNEQKEEKDKREKAAAAAATRAAKSSVASKAPKAANKSAKTVGPPATRPEIKNAKAKVNSFPVQRTAAQLKKQDKEKEPEKSKDKEQREKDKQKEQDKEREKDKPKEQDKQKDKENRDAEKDTKEKLKPTAGASTLARSSSNCSSARTTHLIKRQKSDLTGLKMTSLHKEYMRSEKNALRKQQKEQKEQSNNAVVNVANGDGEYEEGNRKEEGLI